LTDEQKLKRVPSCGDFLTRYNAEGEEFLARIVTGIKPGFIIMNQNPKGNSLNVDTHPFLQRKVQVGTLCQKTYAYIVQGY
jgi:hypothetical protein